jgi:hypothetical protein
VITGAKTISPSIVAAAIIAASTLSTSAIARGPDSPVELLGGSLTVDGLAKNGAEDHYDSGNSLLLDLGLNGLGFAGEMTLNATTQSSDSDIYFKYGDRLTSPNYKNGGNQVEVYSFQASHLGDEYDINLFYHVPRYHWGYEGDAFGLMYETTNMADQDIWNEKAPAGFEFVGKGSLNGLKVVSGEEIYWGADPMTMAKYQFGDKKQYSVVGSFNMTDGPIEGFSEFQRLSLQGKFELSDTSTLDIGVLRSGAEKVGQTFRYDDGNNVYEDRIESSDAYAFKARITEKFSGGTTAYAEFNHAGLVADAGEHQEIFTTGLPHSELGNKRTLEIGGEIVRGSWMFKPRAFVRRNLVDALSPAAQAALGKKVTRSITTPETILVSPFSVTSNREAEAIEIFATYDTTPNTYFYEWDNYLKEDAPIAFNIGLTHINFRGKTDSNIMDFDTGAFPDAGRGAERVTKVEGRLVLNPSENIRLNMNFAAGKKQPIFSDVAVSDFSSVDGTVVHASKNLYHFKLARDAFGEYDFQEDQGIAYPLQMVLGYERILDLGDGDSRVGVKGTKRTNDGAADESEVRVYLTYSF